MPRPSPPRGRRSAFRRRADGNFSRPPLQPPDAPTRRCTKWPGDLDFWPFDLESGILVTCDVGYLCANFGLSRPLCSRLRPDIHDRQTDRRQTVCYRLRWIKMNIKHRLMPPPIRGGGIICNIAVLTSSTIFCRGNEEIVQSWFK